MGLSPWEYRNKVTDFSSAGKPLNFLMVIAPSMLIFCIQPEVPDFFLDIN